MQRAITYFETPGKENTDDTLHLAKECLESEHIRRVILASTTGSTARKAMELFKDTDVELIVIPHQYGFDKPENKFDRDLIPELEEAGHRVFWSTMLFHTDGFYGNGAPSAMANILRCFCQGMKVCFEMAFMATDGGCVEDGEEVIVVAGTGRGSDTAIRATAATTQNMGKFNVHEILCMSE